MLWMTKEGKILVKFFKEIFFKNKINSLKILTISLTHYIQPQQDHNYSLYYSYIFVVLIVQNH